jgi:hypothetical protein
MSKWFDNDAALTEYTDREDVIRKDNRRLALAFTRKVRRAISRTDLTVKLPWNDDVQMVRGDEWHVAEIMSCGEKPKVAGRLPFRINGTVEFGIMEIKVSVLGEKIVRRS